MDLSKSPLTAEQIKEKSRALRDMLASGIRQFYKIPMNFRDDIKIEYKYFSKKDLYGFVITYKNENVTNGDFEFQTVIYI